MFLQEMRLIDFRSFREFIITDFQHINALVGDNGTGKTNFLEGIYLLSSNRGFRTGDRKELTNKHAEGFFLQGNFDDEIIARTIFEKKKSLTLNEENIPANKLRVYNPVITFSPNDIFLATGSSDTRRKFFDAAIALKDDEYSDILALYERALRQRNAALKKDPKHSDLWNDTLIQCGAKLIQKRIDFAKLLKPKVETLYQELAQGKAKLQYFNNFKCSQDIEQSLKDALTQTKSDDLRRKHTTKGPHRDDISLFIDELPAAKSGSQGQNRTLAFALKIGSVEIIEESLGRKPIILIDDALLEVDPGKKQRIFQKFYDSGLQLFLTGTTKEFFDFIPQKDEVKFITF